MATKKKAATKKPTKQPATQKKTATTAAAKKPAATKPAVAGVDAPLVASVQALLAAWPPISDVSRDAFRSRAPDAVCDDLGTRTKSAGVAREAVTWAKTIDATLRAGAARLRPYSAARFVWLLENVRALVDARAAAHADTKQASATRDGASSVEIVARAARNDLLGLLEALAGDARDDRAALDAARGGSTRKEEIAASLLALAELAAAWLARKDAHARALVDAIGLAQGDVDRARAASAALVAASGSAMGGRVDARDPAAVNRVEGRVLFEMRSAMAAFANAHARDKEIPRLVPGAATRPALSPGKAAAPEGDAVAPAGPPAPTA